MPVTADLTYPPTGTGELHPEWWPDGVLPGLLDVWIEAGVAQVPAGATVLQADRVTLTYAYWLAYADLVLTMATRPNSISVEKGDVAVGWTDGQRKIIQAKVTFWMDEYTMALSDATEAMPVIDNAPRASFSQPILRAF